MPSAPPPGIVLETAVDVSVATKACRYFSPGVAPTMTNRYVARFHAAASASVAISSPVIARIADQTLDMLVNCGMKYQKIPTTIASETAPDSTGRSHRLRVGVAGVASTAGLTVPTPWPCSWPARG